MKISIGFSNVLIFFCLLYSYETTDDFHVVSRNCPFLRNYNNSELENFKKLTNFKECHNWTAIIAIDSTLQFSSNNTENIKCLLLYESFISFCNHLPESYYENHDIIFGKVVNLPVTQVCNNLTLLPKRDLPLKHINNVIDDERKCEYLCSTYQEGKMVLDRICADSYYYNNVDITENRVVVDASPKNNVSARLDPKAIPSIEALPPKLESLQHQIEVTPITKHKLSDDSPAKAIESPGTDTAVQNAKKVNSQEIIAPGDLHPNIQAGLEQNAINEETKNEENEKKDIPQQKISNSDNRMDINESENRPEEVMELVNNNQAKTSDDNTGDQQPVPETGIESRPDLNEIDYDTRNSDKPDVVADQEEIQGGIPNKDQPTIPDRFKAPKPEPYGQPFASSDADMDGNSNFFTYFSLICVAFVICYVGYHNKQKILALLVEGRNSKRPQRGRRPNSANYHKLDSNLEEAISSSCSKKTSHVIY